MSIEITDSRAKIKDFLMHNHLGVLATANQAGEPHAAAVYFVTDSDLNFLFITKEKTQKNDNLQQNPAASLAIYDARTQTTLQVDGQVVEEKDPQAFMNLFTQILKVSMDQSDGATPPVSKLQAGEYKMYSLSPKKLRLAEYTKPEHGDLDDIFELVNL